MKFVLILSLTGAVVYSTVASAQKQEQQPEVAQQKSMLPKGTAQLELEFTPRIYSYHDLAANQKVAEEIQLKPEQSNKLNKILEVEKQMLKQKRETQAKQDALEGKAGEETLQELRASGSLASSVGMGHDGFSPERV